MSIRFKFRSSVAFDSIDIGSHPSISVRDLRSKIADRKKLQTCGDFDLVLSDADTGQAFEDENFQIPACANVVIKRVPTGRETSLDRAVIPDTAGKSGGLGTLPITRSEIRPENFGMHNFDDFGVDVYPNMESTIHCNADDIEQFNSTFNQKEDVAIRVSEVSNLRNQNVWKGYLGEALSNEVTAENISREVDEGENHKVMNTEDNGDLKEKLCEDMPSQVILNADLPAELRCSLCNTIFEEAVMIPCCQHSFCNKCIAMALAKKSSCPKCSSTKCTVKDLLPNLSLRQAIEHFLEAQNAVHVSYNNLPRYAPDGESGIQAKDVSCAVSVHQQEPTACQHSPSATGMGSNHFISEPASESGRVVIPPSKYRKYERNCYMCGSPDHLIRECPHSKRGNAVVSGGIPPYRDSYWHGPPFPNVPYANIYGPSSMMSFDPMMFHVAPFSISSCLPPMYNSPTPYGFMGMGAVPPLVMSGVEAGPYAGSLNNQNVDRKQTSELQERYHESGLSEDYFSAGTRRSHEHLSHPNRETSSDNDDQWAQDKASHHKPHQRPSYQVDKDYLVDAKPKEHYVSACGRDRRTNYSEKSKSDLLDVSVGSGRNSLERKSHQYKSSKHSESDCSYRSHHRSQLSDDDDFATYPKRHSYKHYNHSNSGLEPESLTEPRKVYKKRESSHSYRHSSKIVKTRDASLDDDTWEKRNREGHYYHSHRRIR